MPDVITDRGSSSSAAATSSFSSARPFAPPSARCFPPRVGRHSLKQLQRPPGVNAPKYAARQTQAAGRAPWRGA